MKILMPVDLVQPIEPVIDLLQSLVTLSHCEVTLLYVRELLPAYENVIKTSGSFVDDWDKKVETKAQEQLDEYHDKLKHHARVVTTEITVGPTAATICNVIEDEQPDLLVMAPRSARSIPARFFSGSVSSRVIDNTDVATIVARPNLGTGDILKNVVIGFDGSENARIAVERSIGMFRLAASKAKVSVVYSVNVAEPLKFLSPVEFIAAMEQNLLMAGETYLAQAEKLLFDGQVRNVDCLLIEGDPAAGLIKVAQDVNAELIIMGAKGHGTVADKVLGSVTHKVAMHAHCSVAIMRKGLEPDA